MILIILIGVILIIAGCLLIFYYAFLYKKIASATPIMLAIFILNCKANVSEITSKFNTSGSVSPNDCPIS